MDMPTDTRVRSVSRLVASPGKQEELRTLLERAGAAIRTMPGCISWHLMVNTRHAAEFVVVAEWVSEEAYRARIGTPEWIETTGQLPDVTTGEIHHDLFRLIA